MNIISIIEKNYSVYLDLYLQNEKQAIYKDIQRQLDFLDITEIELEVENYFYNIL